MRFQLSSVFTVNTGNLSKFAMNKCNYCGKENPDEAAFCTGCGQAIAPAPDGWEPLVGAEASGWILLAFRWALEQFGSDVFYQHTILVTPTHDHFPDQAGDPHQKALLAFQRVQKFMGIEHWPCKLVAQQPGVNPVVDPFTVMENAPQSPGGTFSVRGVEEPQVVITYNPATVQRPQALVAILAHELAHYLGRTAQCPPPGGEKNWEYATDLLAVFSGFGLFSANSACDFHQFRGYNNQGWSSRTLGYLSEFEFAYCLAVFCTLKHIDRKQVIAHLKRSLIPVYDDSMKDLRRKAKIVDDLSRIRTTATRADGTNPKGSEKGPAL
jgi:zinc-ribbon domain